MCDVIAAGTQHRNQPAGNASAARVWFCKFWQLDGCGRHGDFQTESFDVAKHLNRTRSEGEDSKRQPFSTE